MAYALGALDVSCGGVRSYSEEAGLVEGRRTGEGRRASIKRFIVVACRVAAWSLAGLITILTIVPPDIRPETPLPHNVEHFAIFAAAGWAFGMGYSDRKFTIASLLVFASAIELSQLVVPGRHARLSDLIVDAVALVIADVIGASFARRLEKIQL